MMRFVFCVSTLICLGAGSAQAGPEAAAVLVRHYARGFIDAGSGTVVGHDRGASLVLTNNHVCPTPGERITVEVGGHVHPATWLRADSGIDLALLRVDAALPTVELADRPPPPGTRIEQWGHPRGGPAVHKVGVSGRVDGRRAVPGGGEVATHGIGAESGDSGCGVFCGGKLVGVCWGTGGPGRESCVTLADVKAFLKGSSR